MSAGGGPLSSFTGGGGGGGVRSSLTVRSPSQGGPGGVGSGMGKQTRSKRDEARNDTNRLVSTTPSFGANAMSLEPVAPLEYLKLSIREDLELAVRT